ncbi:MAG: DNA polymerase [Candidatus Pacebacteria bacterium]|nr:DNA polymerase [Candidatus Paceibacterota bacterium]
MSSRKEKIVLLDAHAIIHRAYHALPGFSTRTGMPTGAIFGFGSMILRIIGDLKPDYVIACYDLPGKTFRHEAFDEYKGTRGETDDSLKLQFDATREMCEALDIPIYDAEGFEADDILGTISAKLKSSNIDVVIASGDMDTLQLVDGEKVQVFTLKKGLNDTVVYDEKAVRERFGFAPISIVDFKALRGDASDNIPGIKGIGEKAATIAITHFATIENLYAALEKNEQDLLDAGLTQRMVTLIREGKEDAEFSKILATIRKDAPIHFKLPKQKWGEALSMEKTLEIFERYELHSLGKRLKTLLHIEDEKEQIKENFSEEDLKKLALKLWVLDSDETDASFIEIKEYTKEKTFSRAQKKIDTELAQDARVKEVYDYIEEPLFPIVQQMQKTGVAIDEKFFKQLKSEYAECLTKLEEKIFQFSSEPFNIKSPKQLSKVLFEDLALPTKGIKKLQSGSYSTNVDTLEKLAEAHPIIPLLVEFREFEKLLSTYIEVIPTMVAEDKRLHAEFLQNGTSTGRFSSRNPNLQNIPTRTENGQKIRQGFVAEKGYSFISFDYSQIELRCLALLSGDKALTKIFKEHDDIHSGVAALIGGVPINEVTKEMRRKAKIINFGILYGMGINSLKKEMDVSREEAESFYYGFFDQFPDATKYLEDAKELARKRGYTETFFGRRRQFKNINSKLPFIRAMAERMALNAPIQGTSADMIKLAMIHIHQWLEEQHLLENIRLVLQIHDEIIYEVEDSLCSQFEQKAQEIMENVLEISYKKVKSEVPFVVKSSVGKNWGELK